MRQSTGKPRPHKLNVRSAVPSEVLERLDLAEKYRLVVEENKKLKARIEDLEAQLARRRSS